MIFIAGGVLGFFFAQIAQFDMEMDGWKFFGSIIIGAYAAYALRGFIKFILKLTILICVAGWILIYVVPELTA